MAGGTSQEAAKDRCFLGDRLTPQVVELTIFAPIAGGPSRATASNPQWANATQAVHKDSALGTSPLERGEMPVEALSESLRQPIWYTTPA